MERRLEEFDYLNSDLSERFNTGIKVRSTAMFEKEVKERARLLYNLQYPLKKAISRIKNNIEWEFDHSWNKDDPAVLAEVERIVGDHYGSMKGRRD